MNTNEDMKQCVRGEQCLHLEQVNGGWLPLWAFNDGEGTYGLRAECKVCQSYYMNTANGAKERLAARYGGNVDVSLRELRLKRNKSVDMIGVAVMLDISYFQARSLVYSGLIKSLEEEPNAFRKEIVKTLYQHPDVEARRQASSDVRFMNANRINLSEKRNPRFSGDSASQLPMNLVEDVTPAQQSADDALEFAAIKVFVMSAYIVVLKCEAGVRALTSLGAHSFGVSEDEYLELIAPPILKDAIDRARKFRTDYAGIIDTLKGEQSEHQER